MNQITITKTNFENEVKQSVNARDLHLFLESKQDFSTWIKNRLQDFIENIDFISFHKIVEREIGATKKLEYFLTIETAKHLAMLERNDKGKEIRNYFIKIEEEVKKQQATLPQIDANFLLQVANQMKALEEEKERLTIETQEKQVKIDTQDKIIKDMSLENNEYGFRLAVKKLGVQEKALKEFCKKNKIIMYLKVGSDKLKMTPTEEAKSKGLVRMIHEYVDEIQRSRMVFTQKGFEFLTKHKKEIESYE